MKIKIDYDTACGQVTVEKTYKYSPGHGSQLDHVSVSGPYPAEVMLMVQRWAHEAEYVKTEEEKQALLPKGLDYAKEVWSEIS